MRDSFFYKKRRSIVLKSALISLAMCFVVGGGICWYVSNELANRAFENSLSRLNDKANTSSLAISGAIWEFDLDTISSLTTGLVNDPAIHKVIIYGENNRLIQENISQKEFPSQSLFNSWIQRSIHLIAKEHKLNVKEDLFYTSDEKSVQVGVIEIIGSIEYEIEKISRQVMYLIQSVLVIGITIFLTVIFVTYHFVTKPLSLISARIRDLDPDHPVLKKTFKIGKSNQGDEIDLINKTIEMFAKKVQASNEKVRASEQRFKDLIENSLQGFTVINVDNQIIYANTIAAQMFGYKTAAEFIKVGNYVETFYDTNLMLSLDEIPKTGHINQLAEKRKCKDNHLIYIDNNLNIIEWNGEPHKQVVMIDVTDRVAAEQELRSLVTRDKLTDLPNRSLMIEHITTKAKSSGKKVFYILYIDISSFHKVNDLFGRETGDEVLIFISNILKKSLQEESILGHMGGGHFVILTPNGFSLGQLYRLRKEILDLLKFRYQPKVSDNTLDERMYDLELEASFSACAYPQDGENPTALLNKCEQLNKYAKQDKQSEIQVFNPELDKKLNAAIQIEKKISIGIDNNEFYLVYQPKINAKTGALSGCEALVRWKSDQGEIYPDQFISVAEESKLIIPLGRQIMYMAGRQIMHWREQGIAETKVAINVSAIQLVYGDIYDDFLAVHKEFDLNPGDIQIEITESTTMQQLDLITPKLNRLREFGAEIAIDDFGTGYSSLSYLKELPVTHLKLDRSFVTDLPEPDALAIAKGIVGLGHALGLIIVAEGVENQDQADYLKSLNYDQFQGYLFSRPLLPDAYASFAKTNISK
ncbi:MAG: EAL domain-containing protein [Halopseudomonas aestusnigri]